MSDGLSEDACGRRVLEVGFYVYLLRLVSIFFGSGVQEFVMAVVVSDDSVLVPDPYELIVLTILLDVDELFGIVESLYYLALDD